jgi:hypothetical protein
MGPLFSCEWHSSGGANVSGGGVKPNKFTSRSALLRCGARHSSKSRSGPSRASVLAKLAAKGAASALLLLPGPSGGAVAGPDTSSTAHSSDKPT